MARVQIATPEHFPFSCLSPVRITDLNYGKHVGNDTVLSFIHEARVQFLRSRGLDEVGPDQTGLIMGDVAIQFRQEIFYGHILRVYVAVMDMGRVGFDLVYKMETTNAEGNSLPVSREAVLAKTGMVCFDYRAGKIMSVPPDWKSKLS